MHYQTKPPHHDCFYPTTSITNSNREVLEFVAERFGGSCAFKGYSRVGTSLYRWRTQGAKHLSRFLADISPYLTIKRREYLILQEFLSLGSKHNPSKRRELRDQIQWTHHDRSVETDTSEFESWKPNLIHAYHAGLMDGENTISLQCYPNSKGSQNFKKTIIFTNTFRPVVEQFLLYGGRINTTPANGNRLTKYDWQIFNQHDQERFLLNVLPYLIVKREPAKILLEYLRIDGPNPSKRRELMQRIKAFQMKGPGSNKIQSELVGNHESAPMGTLVA